MSQRLESRPLGSLVTITGGGTPSKARPEYYQGDVPWVTPKDMKSWNITDAKDHITEEAIARSATKLIEPESILLVIRSGILKHTLPVGINRVPVAINQDMKALRCGPGVDPDYLARALQWSAPRVLGSARATTADNIPLDVVRKLQIPVPPLAEQRRIAAILDKADATRRKRQQAIQLTDDLLRFAFLDMFGDPVTNPRGWPTRPLAEVARFIGGGTPDRQEKRFFQGSIPWATPKDIRTEILEDTEEHINDKGISSSAAQVVEAGTILIVVKSKVLMNRLPIAIAQTACCFSQDLKAIVPSPETPATYLARHMKIGGRALLHAARGANTEGLTLDHLRSYRVMMTGEEMWKWAAFEVAAGTLRKRHNRALSDAETLFGALSQRAFCGEL